MAEKGSTDRRWRQRRLEERRRRSMILTWERRDRDRRLAAERRKSLQKT